MLEENILLVDNFFVGLKKFITNINCSVKKRGADSYKIEFTHYHSFNGWSHLVKLVAEEGKTYFQTYRLKGGEELEKYKFTSYSGNDNGYRIPLSEKFLILKVLTEMDRFKSVM